MNVGSVGINIAANIRPLETGVAQAVKVVDGFSAGATASIEKFGARMAAVGSRLTLGITTPIVGVGAASLKMAGDFGTAMAEVSTLLSDTSEIGTLTESVKQLSAQFGKMPTEQAAALYQIISAGATSAAQATDVLTVANRLAIGGVTDVKTAADGLTTILNAYGDSAGTATQVSDALFVAMQAGKTTIGELSGSIGAVAPLAAQAGASLEEVLAGTAALTKGGVSTSVAMTGLRAALAAVVKPTSEATKMAQSLGIEFNATALKSKGLASFLQDVTAKTGGSTEALAQLFGGVESLVPVLALTGAASEDFGTILEAMQGRAGATEAAFEKMSDTAAFKFGQLKTSLTLVAIEIGNNLIPAILPLGQKLSEVLARVQALSPEALRLGLVLAAIAAAAGPAALAVSGLAKAFGLLAGTLAVFGGAGGILVFGKLAVTVRSAGDAVALFGAAFPAVSSAITEAAMS